MRSEALGGAFVASKSRELTKSQRVALRRILIDIALVAIEEAGLQTTKSATYEKDQEKRRPRHVYLIDGARGAGKTTVLLTLQALVSEIGRRAGEEAETGKMIEALVKEGEKGLHTGSGDGKSSATTIFAPIGVGGREHARPVCVVKAIFPADINGGEHLIEAVFARIRKLIQDTAEERKATAQLEKVESERDELVKRLDEKVAGSWRLSRPVGRDAIQRDSFNVEHFLKKSAEFDGFSQHRVDIWHAFVNDLLKYLDAQILAIFFDDTDTEADENYELLQAIRIFFDHPRIVSVVAGNLKAIRRSLIVHHRSSRPGSADPAATRSDDELGRLVEEYLEKVLPPPNRHFLTRPETPVLDGRSFDRFCFDQLDAARMDYLRAKLRAARGPLTPPDTFEGALAMEDGVALRGTPVHGAEHYTSWWLLRHYYVAALAPRTMRQMVHMHQYVTEPSREDSPLHRLRRAARGGDSRGKRLAVMLFEMSENSSMVRLFADADNNVLDWLHRQVLSSGWTGDRYFEIDGKRYYGGKFEFDFICYRVDLGIAAPILNNPEEDLPSGLLPFPVLPRADLSGRRLTRARGRALKTRRYGVSKWIDHTIVPRNCIYMFDLPALNQWIWRGEYPADSPMGAALWAPNEIHPHWDYGHKWKNGVLDDAEAFADARSYWDLHVRNCIQASGDEARKQRLEAGEEVWIPEIALEMVGRDALTVRWKNEEKALLDLRRKRSAKLAAEQRTRVADYVRRVVPLAAASQLCKEEDPPNCEPDPPDTFWRGDSLSEFSKSLNAPMGKVEQGIAFLRREMPGTAPAAGAGARQELSKAWSDFGDELRKREKDRRFVPLAPFAAILNDFLGAHMALRVFENDVANVVKAEVLAEKADKVERAGFLKYRRVMQRFLERKEAFSSMEPARIVTLEDIQTLLSQMGRANVLPPESHLDLARMCMAMKDEAREEGKKLEGADAWQRGLACFIIRVLLKKAKRRDNVGPLQALSKPLRDKLDEEAIGYDVPIGKDDVGKIEDLVKQIASIAPGELLKPESKKVWRDMVDLCGENLVGVPRRDLVAKEATQAAYWMCPEYVEFAARARVARALMLFLYAFTPFMRSLYEVDREAFLGDRTLDDWKNSGRPFMWAEAAAKMRNFVRRFSDILRLGRLRLELYTFAYGDGAKDSVWGEDADLIAAIRGLGGVKLKEKKEREKQNNSLRQSPFKGDDWFKNRGGVRFTHMPDFSHKSLGVNFGAEGDTDATGILQSTFEAIGEFFEFVYPEVPEVQWPSYPYRDGGANAGRAGRAAAKAKASSAGTKSRVRKKRASK